MLQVVDCRGRVSSYTFANSIVFFAMALVYSSFLQRLSAYPVRPSEYRISVSGRSGPWMACRVGFPYLNIFMVYGACLFCGWFPEIWCGHQTSLRWVNLIGCSFGSFAKWDRFRPWLLGSMVCVCFKENCGCGAVVEIWIVWDGWFAKTLSFFLVLFDVARFVCMFIINKFMLKIMC